MAYPSVGSRNSLSISGITTLSAGTYLASSSYNCSTTSPLDVIIELTVGVSTSPSSRKAVAVFLQESLDGTNFRSGPTSGTTTTDEADLKFIGTVPVNSATSHTGFFSVFTSLSYLPKYFKVVVKNDTGVALTSGSLYTAEIA